MVIRIAGIKTFINSKFLTSITFPILIEKYYYIICNVCKSFVFTIMFVKIEFVQIIRMILLLYRVIFKLYITLILILLD